MSAIRSNGALWQSGEHRIPAPAPAQRGEPGRLTSVDVVTLYRELGRWKARATELERRLAAAESQVLSTQLTPHFLCNSLQAVSTLLHRDPQAADTMVVALSDLLRMAVRGATVPEVSLGRELTLLRRYVEVMQFRFEGALRLTIEGDAGLRDARIPQLLLQPLVENAIMHGFADRPGHVRVTLERRGDMLHCTVVDDGRGLPPGQVAEGVGLAGTRGRLRALYGDRHCFELRTSDTGGASVALALPYRVGFGAAEVGP